jgi:hypothetical protein
MGLGHSHRVQDLNGPAVDFPIEGTIVLKPLSFCSSQRYPKGLETTHHIGVLQPLIHDHPHGQIALQKDLKCNASAAQCIPSSPWNQVIFRFLLFPQHANRVACFFIFVTFFTQRDVRDF